MPLYRELRERLARFLESVERGETRLMSDWLAIAADELRGTRRYDSRESVVG